MPIYYRHTENSIDYNCPDLKKFIVISILCFLSLWANAQEPTMIVDLRGQWKFNIGDNLNWAALDYDDETWGGIFVPSRWENEGFSGYDGFAWYRKSFDYRPATNKDHHILDLGYIDDADEVFFNGVLIGKGGEMPPNYRTSYDSHRTYFVPNELIKWGENQVAVRVYDRSQDGGIVKGKQGLYVRENMPVPILSLEGIWKILEEDEPEFANPDYNDEYWENTLVPGFWKSYKDHSFTKIFFTTSDYSVAWFRKSFILPDDIGNMDDLVIVLGKIDDFDETYLNGHLIGKTKDGKRLGESQSYDRIRIYPLPAKYLNLSRPNVIAVKVEDIGIDSGIYQGPIVITTRKDAQKLIQAYRN
ncbi:MAG: hypothetical protein ACJA08_000087 [Cyclobacteriaceae bacterium]|jgi:hypothetical protein